MGVRVDVALTKPFVSQFLYPLLRLFILGCQADAMFRLDDDDADNKCTWFMFIKPNDMGRELLTLWRQEIIDTNAATTQVSEAHDENNNTPWL